jgi:hypothetical protein
MSKSSNYELPVEPEDNIEKLISSSPLVKPIEKGLDALSKTGNLDETLSERIKWATTKPNKIVKTDGKTIGAQKKEAQKKEKKWG